jgi:tRNA-dihydrouridine synthase B
MTNKNILSTPMKVGPVELRNRVFLAPMSGVTDRPMRERAYAHGAGLVISEMVASGELAKGHAGSMLRIERSGDCPHMVQLAGREAIHMAEAARIAEGEGADIIDINMGCPAKKVTGGYCGSALMREPDQAIRLVEAVVGAVRAPVTVKMRLGWDDKSLNAPEIARRAQDAGAQMVTVHGRTRCQFYTGNADWQAVARVRDAISVPLVVNGDVRSSHDAEAALNASGADAVMIGRGHYGMPWLAGVIAGEGQGAPDARCIADYVVEHYDAMLSHYGVEQGYRHARKHSGWYLDHHAPETDEQLRTTIMTERDPLLVKRALRSAFDPEHVTTKVNEAV